MRRRGARLKVAVLVGIALLSVGSASALSGQASSFESYFHRIIDRDAGLPEPQINAVAQTADGYLWLGTHRGPVRIRSSARRWPSPLREPT